MTAIEKLSLDLTLIRSVYRTGDFTPGEVIREVMRRIRTNSKQDIWVALVDESVLFSKIAKIEDRLDLPLAGVPFAVSDNIDVAGMPTAAGCWAFSTIPETSAFVVDLLESAGAILIGKTAVEPFGVGISGALATSGGLHSHFSQHSVAGGPAAGAALGVAAGMVSFAIGTDTTGSGQIPGALNHLVALKPTRGIVSTVGIVPGCRSLDCVDIFADSVSDAASVLDILAVENPADPGFRETRNPKRFERPFRFGVPKSDQLDFHSDLDAEVNYLKALERLEGLGGKSVEIDFAPFLEASDLVHGGTWSAERYAAVGPFIEQLGDAIEPYVAARILRGRDVKAVEVFQASYKLETLKKRAVDVWNHIDALVVPPVTAIVSLDEAKTNPDRADALLGETTGFINLLDLTSVTVPMGFRTDGIPCGLSLIAPAFSDWELCRLAKVVSGETLSVKSGRPTNADEHSDIVVAVTGTHLTGERLNSELTSRQARFRESVETAPDYALFALSSEPPRSGLINVGPMMGVAIEAELWALSPESFAALVAQMPPPTSLGTIQLKDGRVVKGFLCEEYATHKAEPISAFGSWRDYRNSK